jgi:hypothetical protein
MAFLIERELPPVILLVGQDMLLERTFIQLDRPDLIRESVDRCLSGAELVGNLLWRHSRLPKGARQRLRAAVSPFAGSFAAGRGVLRYPSGFADAREVRRPRAAESRRAPNSPVPTPNPEK